jgi:hypothetical protein
MQPRDGSLPNFETQALPLPLRLRVGGGPRRRSAKSSLFFFCFTKTSYRKLPKKITEVSSFAVCVSFVLCNRHWFNMVPYLLPVYVSPYSDAGFADLPLVIFAIIASS